MSELRHVFISAQENLEEPGRSGVSSHAEVAHPLPTLEENARRPERLANRLRRDADGQTLPQLLQGYATYVATPVARQLPRLASKHGKCHNVT